MHVDTLVFRASPQGPSQGRASLIAATSKTAGAANWQGSFGHRRAISATWVDASDTMRRTQNLRFYLPMGVGVYRSISNPTDGSLGSSSYALFIGAGYGMTFDLGKSFSDSAELPLDIKLDLNNGGSYSGVYPIPSVTLLIFCSDWLTAPSNSKPTKPARPQGTPEPTEASDPSNPPSEPRRPKSHRRDTDSPNLLREAGTGLRICHRDTREALKRSQLPTRKARRSR